MLTVIFGSWIDYSFNVVLWLIVEHRAPGHSAQSITVSLQETLYMHKVWISKVILSSVSRYATLDVGAEFRHIYPLSRIIA
jgi:hypothetical protein